MRRIALILAACIAAALAALAPAALGAGTSLTASGVPTFPERSWILTLPRGVTVAPHDVRVRENGAAVRDLQVAAADDGASRGLGVVLVIDSSESMAGGAIADAMAAARTFAGQRSAGQRLGVVTFDSSASVALAPTTDPAKIDAALTSTPALHGGTHLFDATATAVDLLRRSGGSAGAVIVLSDGSDRGSTATAQTVAAAAARAHIRVFTVGVTSDRFESGTLKGLASAASGEYLGAAGGASLVKLYRDLGGQLANAYVLRYRSTEPVGATVDVAATAHGRTATAQYRAPSLAVVARARRDAQAAHEETFLQSTVGIMLATLATLLAAFFLLWTIMAARRSDRNVRDRVADYGTAAMPSLTPLSADPTPARAAGGPTWRARLGDQLELARIDATPNSFVALVAACGLGLTWVAAAAANSILIAPLTLLVTWLAARSFVQRRVASQRAAFAEQLPDSLQNVASAMRTGHSFAGALAVLTEDGGEPTRTEFSRIVADERIGVPLEDALQETVRRMDSRDLEQVALVAVLQRETGGNGAEALDRVVENLRGRAEVRRLVKSLTSQGVMTRWVLTGIPIALAALLSVVSPGYMDPLFTTTIGRSLLVLIVLLICLGSWLIKRIVDIKV